MGSKAKPQPVGQIGDLEARQCGLDCGSSTARARLAPPVWRANSHTPLTARSTLRWENTLDYQAGPDGELASLAWMESLSHEKWISSSVGLRIEPVCFRQTKDASFIGAARISTCPLGRFD